MANQTKYSENYVLTKEAIEDIVIHMVTDVSTTSLENGVPAIKIKKGGTQNGTSYNVPVGSNIVFKTAAGDNLSKMTNTGEAQKTGTFRVAINSDLYEVPISGLAGGAGEITLNGSTTIDGNLIPNKNNTYDIGSTSKTWKDLYLSGDIGNASTPVSNIYSTNIGSTSTPVNNIYGTTGNFTNLIINGTNISTTNISKINTILNGPSQNTDQYFFRGDRTWSNTLNGSLNIKGLTTTGNINLTGNLTTTGTLYLRGDKTGINLGAYGNYNDTAFYGTGSTLIWYNGEKGESATDVNTSYGPENTVVIGASCNANLSAKKVFNAVFNDYAECRTTINLTPGHIVIDQDDGSLSCSSFRLQPGAQVISDTYGHLMGETDTAKTPIAVAGRVLVYTYQSRENYHAGMAVCSAPNGTVDIMTREEIRDYPDCIVGIVSEIPQYETWGTDNIKVNGRIWIKVK